MTNQEIRAALKNLYSKEVQSLKRVRLRPFAVSKGRLAPVRKVAPRRRDTLIPQEGYNSSEVSRICGVSLRQLQWWDERNLVSPRQDYHKRVYMAEEVVEISVIAELRRKGLSLKKIRRVLRFLQKDVGKRLVEALSSSADVYLLTDGKSVYFEDSPGRIIDLLKSARIPMFAVSITDQVKRLSSAHERKPARSEPITSMPSRFRSA